MDGRQKINPLSLNYILLPFLILSDIRPVGFKYIIREI